MAEEIAERQSLDRSTAEWVLRTTSPTSAGVGGIGDYMAFATDGDVSVLFDGTLYEPAPSAAVEVRPAERILAGFLRHGSSMFESLRGAYSIIVLDARCDEVLMVRDHMGTVPLFWANGGDGDVLISQSPKALATQPDVGNELNLPALGEWVLLRWLYVEETLFRSVRRIPAGHFLRISGTDRELIRYWRPLAVAREDWVTEDEIDRFDDVFALAVRRCLALGKSGILLSGGLDSVSVAAIAKLESDASGQPPPVALWIAFPDASCNEEEVQRSVAQTLGLPQIMRGLFEAAGDDNLLRATIASCPDWPQPAISYWIPSYESLLKEGVAEGCEVVMTGMGGDEWLGVSPYYSSNLIRGGNVVALYRLWRDYTRSHSAPPFIVAKNMLWRFGVRDLLIGLASRILNKLMPDTMRSRRRRLLEGSFPAWAVPDAELGAVIRERMLQSRDNHSERDLYRRELETGLLHPLVALEAEENHGRGVRAGAPLRHPFLDADVVQFLARTPPELLNRGGRSKGAVRQMVARRLPGLGFERQKKIAATSFSTANLLDKLPIVWRELGGLRELSSLGVVSESGIDVEASRVFRQRDAGGVHRLWYLLVLEAWVRGQRTGAEGGSHVRP